MGGSGPGGYVPPTTGELMKKIEEARERELAALRQAVDDYLRRLLAAFNDRDADATRQHLSDVAAVFGDEFTIETLLLGGSVAKHTFVDGLSDVDALVVLEKREISDYTPRELLSRFLRAVRKQLSDLGASSVKKGNLALTIDFKDGLCLQLLPAIRSGREVEIPDAEGKDWKPTRPGVFQRRLARANEQAAGNLIPAIKLWKALNDGLPAQQHLKGYHIEALAADAARQVSSPSSVHGVLLDILAHAAKRVLRPIRDVTSQSRIVDDYLGRADSTARRNLSLALQGLCRQMAAMTSVQQWKRLFEGQ